MKVVSTNISTPTEIIWKGKKELTGIYKNPVSEIFLGTTDVKNDAVIDRKYHGGINKACYLYGANHYQFWKEKYPNLNWNWGMFGENLTIDGLNEVNLCIGDVFSVGETIIKITEPRLPCYKLGIRFKSPKVIKEFMRTSFCGAYVSVLKNGKIKPKDEIKCVEKQNSITLFEVYSIFSSQKNNQTLIKKALNDKHLNEDFKQDIRKKLV